MVLKINLKMKNARFKGDQPRYHTVVSGPTETIPPMMRRFLELQGLSPFKEEDGFSIWASPPAIGGPAAYLVPLLEQRHGVSATREARIFAENAFAEVKPEDGLERFLGARAGVPPGKRPLEIAAGSEDFVANCDEDHAARREALEAAGWLPVDAPGKRLAEKVGTRPYRTRDPFIAGNLKPFMTERALELLALKNRDASRNIALSKSQDAPEGFDVPVPEGVEYLDFQKGGIHQIKSSGKSGIIADDMGLGKTVQGIGLMNARLEARNILVICQANMRLKWAREIEKWQVSDRSIGVAEGAKCPDTDIVVINYDILQKNIEKLRARDWDIILPDEAHNLKNEEAQRTRAVLGDVLDPEGGAMLPMADKGQMVHLTGTPKPNRVSELWTLLTSSRPDLWGRGPEARQVFLNRYQPPFLIKKKIQRGSREFESIIPMQGKPIRETELQLRLRGSGSFIRRLKRDTDLPPKFRTPLDVPVRLSKQDKDMLREAEADLESIAGRVTGSVRSGTTKQASAVIDAISLIDPDTPDFSELARVRRNLGLVKAPHCAKFIMDELEAEKDMAPENRTKTVVFAHHKAVIAKIHEEAEKRMKGAVLVYDGSSGSAAKRQAIIDRFQSDDDVRGIIISLAGATGITLTAAARMRVVEPDWTPSNMVQIEDRIWRIGQERNVDIGYLSVAGTLDARVGNTLVEKMESDEKSMNTISFKNAKKPAKSSVAEPESSRGAEPAEDDAQPSLPL